MREERGGATARKPLPPSFLPLPLERGGAWWSDPVLEKDLLHLCRSLLQLLPLLLTQRASRQEGESGAVSGLPRRPGQYAQAEGRESHPQGVPLAASCSSAARLLSRDCPARGGVLCPRGTSCVTFTTSSLSAALAVFCARGPSRLPRTPSRLWRDGHPPCVAATSGASAPSATWQHQRRVRRPCRPLRSFCEGHLKTRATL